jgi:hypothetical protein
MHYLLNQAQQIKKKKKKKKSKLGVGNQVVSIIELDALQVFLA